MRIKTNQLLDAYIELYKAAFEKISSLELYKWQAIKHFQNTWDLEAEDFAGMLATALGPAKNLLASGNYLPRAVITDLAVTAPEEVREVFRALYRTEGDLIQRVRHFGFDTTDIRDRHHPEKGNTYQDHRAVMVYLSLRFPEDHFLYKYRMFRDAAKTLDLTSHPTRGWVENVTKFEDVCRLILPRLVADEELMELHRARLRENPDCYRDPESTVLTQDFIYAVAFHFKDRNLAKPLAAKPDILKLDEAKPISTLAAKLQAGAGSYGSIGPRHVDWGKRNDRLAAIGWTAEKMVLTAERDALRAAGLPKLAKKVRHISEESGDGAGYDILSYTVDGRRKYIEIKATTGAEDTPFYITRNELEASRKLGDDYYLYRVFALDEGTGSFEVRRYFGSLEVLCREPSVWRVATKV